MSILRSVKSAVRDGLRRRGIYLFTPGSLPPNVELPCDLLRLAGPSGIRLAFDVGANVGETTESFLNLSPETEIHAFEPVSSTFNQLSNRFAREKRVKCARMAISDKEGEGIMRLGDNSLVAHLRSDDGTPPVKGIEEAVRKVTIDAYCEQAGISHIDLLKTDTEGNDVAVLRGANRLLAGGNVRFVISEVGFSQRNRANTFLGDIFDALTDRGFFFYGIYDTRHMTYSSELRWADALFVHRSMLKTA